MSETPDILNAEQMKRWYGSFYDSSPKLLLDHRKIPEKFWLLLPYAEFWGVSDDSKREHLIKRAPADIQHNLKEVVAAFDSALEERLAGPGADDPNPSDEYVAFSTMRMAADYL